jgi:hypothetical protein
VASGATLPNGRPVAAPDGMVRPAVAPLPVGGPAAASASLGGACLVAGPRSSVRTAAALLRRAPAAVPRPPWPPTDGPSAVAGPTGAAPAAEQLAAEGLPAAARRLWALLLWALLL